MGYGALRVINDGRLKPGAGIGTHGHQDMEVLSYVLEGALAHRDGSGGGGVIRPVEIQFMRAGTGITHSEYNDSKVEPVHFLQIWIVPDERGLRPAYAQQPFDAEAAARGVARGSVFVNGQPLREGDGAAARGEGTLEFAGEDASEVLVFGLA